MADIVFIILLALLIIVAIVGLISARRDSRRNNRQLARFIALLHFNHEVCSECEHQTNCKIYALAMGIINKRCKRCPELT